MYETFFALLMLVSYHLCTIQYTIYAVLIIIVIVIFCLNRSHVSQEVGHHVLRGWSSLATCLPLRRTFFYFSLELSSNLIR